MLFEVLALIGGIAILIAMLVPINRPEEEKMDKIEFRSFKLKELKEEGDFYLVRIELKGQEKWKKFPKDRTKRCYLKRQNYQRIDVIKITSYYRKKCWWREVKKTEVSYKIFATGFPKE